MFGKNKPTAETVPSAPAIHEEPKSNISELEVRRAQLQAERGVLQKELDKTTLEVQSLQAQVRESIGKVFPDSPLAISLNQARHTAGELRGAIDKEHSEIDGIDKEIRAILSEPILRELAGHVRTAAALLAQALEPNARAHAAWARLRDLGVDLPETFIREITVDTVCPTLYSKFLDACAQASIEVKKPPADVLTIPPSASFYFRQQADFSHDMRLASNAAGHTAAAVAQAHQAGVEHGFRSGRRGF